MSESVIAFRDNIGGRAMITSRSVHSWPPGGERFISVSGIEGCGEVTKFSWSG